MLLLDVHVHRVHPKGEPDLPEPLVEPGLLHQGGRHVLPGEVDLGALDRREGGALHGVMSVAMWICALGRRRTMWSGVLVFTCVIVRQLRSSRGIPQKSQ